MKKNYLKINAFGKLKNKEINLFNNINLIYGKNEAGKTTLLKFIDSMFYGISKNKNGKEISDFDKYKPWNSEEFSGKIKYELDNNKKYEVFREFSKKNPKIYNENLEEISKEFNIDKNKGNQFFYDQTKIDEGLFLSTNMVEQQSVVLDNNGQSILTQKIANILSSGEDNISYKKVMGKLSKKLIEEVGTERTVDRPLNKVVDEINKLNELKKELNYYSDSNDEIKNKKNNLKRELNKLENELKILKEIKSIKENEQIQIEKININNKIKNEYEDKINNLKNNIKLKGEAENNKIKNKKGTINLIIIGLLIFLTILINFIKTNKIFKNIIICFSIIYLIINLIIYLYKRNKIKKINNKNNIEKIKIEKEIEILEENKKYKNNEIIKLNEELSNKNSRDIELLKNNFKDIFNNEEINNFFNIKTEEIKNELENIDREYTNKKIELNTIEIKEKELTNKMENKLICDEQLNNLQEQKEELLSLERSINIAKDALDEAYNEMKNEITPKFTKDLSLLMEKISNGKHENVSFDAEKGLVVEGENGEYINCNRLSIGTIDQLYLSLRLSSMQQISEEKMPIILDEAFAYYDDERLKNILKFIDDNYKENQIIIFTCSNREKNIMDELNIKYNLINL